MARRIETTVLRVENLCCNKEKAVVTGTLDRLGDSVKSISVNVIARSATVRHVSTLEPDVMVRMLNEKGLGATLAQARGINEDGDHSDAHSLDWATLAPALVFVAMPCILLLLGMINGNNGRFFSARATPILYLLSLGFGGKDLCWKALVSMRSFSLDMNVLMFGVAAVSLALLQFAEAAEVAVLFSIAELVSKAALDRVAALLRSMRTSSFPETARLSPNGEKVPLSAVNPGDAVLVRTGDQCPVDGVVLHGQAALDEAMLTGESLPVTKNAGDEAFAGTLCVAGSVTVEVRRVPTEADAEAQADAVMSAALESSTNVKRLTMRFAQLFTPAVLLVALAALVRNAVAGDAPGEALRASLTVVLVSCPCAVVMASPLVEAIALAVCRRNGLLLRRASALEGFAGAGIMAMDKTGTLTMGRFAVVDEIVVEPTPLKRAFRKAGFRNAANINATALQLAASLEATSSHPLAAAVVNHFSGCLAEHLDTALADPGAGLYKVKEGSQSALAHGRGLRGTVMVPVSNGGGKAGSDAPGIEVRVAIGNKDVLENCLDMDIEAFQERHEARANTTIYVKVNRNEALGLALQDTLRPQAKGALDDLRGLGVEAAILSGDRPDVVRSIAAELGLGFRNAHGAYTATQKEHWVLRARAGGTTACASASEVGYDVEEAASASPTPAVAKRFCRAKKAVIFVGDGMNDEKALRAAEVGVAMGGSGSGIAIDAADAVLLEDDLNVLPWAIVYARRCRRIIFANLVLALLIKLVVAVLALKGVLSLGVAAISDVGGLIAVILNSLWALIDSVKFDANGNDLNEFDANGNDLNEFEIEINGEENQRLSEGMALLGDTHAKSQRYGAMDMDI
mmetsp:Transcript_8553/g.24709  ORF Transcript_8553/g.24709 Transcript_8553/m.24709 type:complete len:856 (-) Transcript_8553:76-2643(-)|eukprot:CAMPEP_0118885790 /NCGR_PEP_ID=MMETSP1163-20130328/24121_1 /TAXON_ID=124430 /ORGANISM="Phaeomonas parva, Strain CCMP2877" /LENGTH=855 /DNA_ID=CAMNT_0006823863 /DNA_START=248 /DNA_END=2815 /DNA_ORIENTATION=-